MKKITNQNISKAEIEKVLIKEIENNSIQNTYHNRKISFESYSTDEIFYNKFEIEYGLCDSQFGKVFVAITKRGIIAISFTEDIESELSRINTKWKNSKFKKNLKKIAKISEEIFAISKPNHKNTFHLLLTGSNFQIKVWETLLKIPQGNLVSYKSIANAIGKPSAPRAIGNAIGANNIGYLIPCHRVIKQNGILDNYKWNNKIKEKLIMSEIFR